jgi:hypothetical protein
VTLDEAKALFGVSANCATPDQARAVAGIALRAYAEHAGWGKLRLQALRALGLYLIRHGRGRGQPPKETSPSDHTLSLAALGITDRHISSDAKKVARVLQRDFTAYLATEPEPTLAGLLRYAEGTAIGQPKAWSLPSAYQVTPPDLYAEWDAEFNFDFDSCPHPRPVGFDGLQVEWGWSTYCNAPFSGVDHKEEFHSGESLSSRYGAWIKKGLVENAKGKLVVFLMPMYLNRVISKLIVQHGAEVRAIGCPAFLSVVDGTPNPSPLPNPCVLVILRPDTGKPTVNHNRMGFPTGKPTARISHFYQNMLDIRARQVSEAQMIDFENSCVEWYTPSEIFTSMSPPCPASPVHFDTDVASPGQSVTPWIPADRFITKRDDALSMDWADFGFCYMNSPYGVRNSIIDWIDKFVEHANGVSLVPDFTSTEWFHRLVVGADATMVMKPKIQFLPRRADGRNNSLGSILVAYGECGVRALLNVERNGRGICQIPARAVLRQYELIASII